MKESTNTEKFECRICGCKHSTVTKTDHTTIRYGSREKTRLVRYRRCHHCGLSYKTVEFVVEEADHKIGKQAALRPIYDYGRAVGQMEVINGERHPSQELPTPNPPQAPMVDKRGRFSNPVEHLASSTSPTEKRPPPKKRKR